MTKIVLLAAAALAIVPAAAEAQSYGQWHYNYQMGVSSFSTGLSGSKTGGRLDLECSPDGSVGLYIEIAGVAAPANSFVIVRTGAKSHRYFTGKNGTVDFASKRAPLLRELWSDLGRSPTLSIQFPNGQTRALSVNGARKTLGPTPCPE